MPGDKAKLPSNCLEDFFNPFQTAVNCGEGGVFFRAENVLHTIDRLLKLRIWALHGVSDSWN